jgi:CBS domain-containing protein
MKAREIITSAVVAVCPDAPIGVVAKVLRDHGISAVPVVDGAGSSLGMVSEGAQPRLSREPSPAGPASTRRHDRAINTGEPSWPATLRSEAAEIYLRRERDLKPHGFRLGARVLGFSGRNAGRHRSLPDLGTAD